MEQESKKDKNSKKALAYVNIHKRTINLSKLGFIEEIKSDLINMHSRRDYKVTLKGIEQLLPYFLVYPDEMKNMVQYMNKFKLDKKAFGNMLSNRVKSMLESMNLYIGSTTYLESLPIDTIQIEQLQIAMFEFNNRLSTIQRSILALPPEDIDSILNRYYEQLHHNLETKNIMSTLRDNGTKIGLSYIHPHKPGDLTKLTKLNIEKMKKTLPRTPETVKYLEGLIKSTFKQAQTKTKTEKSVTVSN